MTETATTRRLPVRDDVAYLLPMFSFLAFTWVGGKWQSLFPLTYLLKTVLVAGMLVYLWPAYTRIRWNHWWLGIIVGVVGVFQWVPMQLLLERFIPPLRPDPGSIFDPTAHFSGTMLWGFLALRTIGAVLVVPVMEELFSRDFLWRRILAPNDFKLADVGEWDWKVFFIVAIAFSFVHGHWALTAIVWAMLVGALLVYTRSLGACIIAHAVTNLLLAGYVILWRDWSFW